MSEGKRTIQISAGYTATVDEENYDELIPYLWTASVLKNRNGEISIVYAWRWTSAKDGPKKKVYMHRQILGITDPSIDVDHKDHDGLNNTRENLRTGSRTSNLGNKRMAVNNTSGYKGVSWYKPTKKWRARIHFQRRLIFIGYFLRKEDAAMAYEKKARELFGDFLFTENVDTRMRVA